MWCTRDMKEEHHRAQMTHRKNSLGNIASRKQKWNTDKWFISTTEQMNPPDATKQNEEREKIIHISESLNGIVVYPGIYDRKKSQRFVRMKYTDNRMQKKNVSRNYGLLSLRYWAYSLHLQIRIKWNIEWNFCNCKH